MKSSDVLDDPTALASEIGRAFAIAFDRGTKLTGGPLSQKDRSAPESDPARLFAFLEARAKDTQTVAADIAALVLEHVQRVSAEEIPFALFPFVHGLIGQCPVSLPTMIARAGGTVDELWFHRQATRDHELCILEERSPGRDRTRLGLSIVVYDYLSGLYDVNRVLADLSKGLLFFLKEAVRSRQRPHVFSLDETLVGQLDGANDVVLDYRRFRRDVLRAAREILLKLPSTRDDWRTWLAASMVYCCPTPLPAMAMRAVEHAPRARALVESRAARLVRPSQEYVFTPESRVHIALAVLTDGLRFSRPITFSDKEYRSLLRIFERVLPVAKEIAKRQVLAAGAA